MRKSIATSKRRLERLVMLLSILGLCVGSLSCASTDKVQALSAKTDQTNLLAIEIRRDQDQLRTELELLRKTVDSLSNQMRAKDAAITQELKELALRLDELLMTFEDLSQRQEALRSAVLDLEDIISSLPGKGVKKAKKESRKRIFAAARQDYDSGAYDSAVMGFRNYVAAYPNSSAADDAQYWIGESFFATEQYEKAITEFARVLRDHPKSDRTAETLLRLGMCHVQLNEPEKTTEFFTRLLERFPDSNEARLARAQLEKLER